MFEILLYFIAQTVPLLRVAFVGSKASSRSGAGSISLAEIPRSAKNKQKRATGAPDLDILAGDHAGVELVELPGGKIVAADAEEAQTHRATGRESVGAVTQEAGEGENQTGGMSHDQEGSDDDAVMVDGEVHKLWADMGLSRRAWSKSPSPQQAVVRRRRQPLLVDLAA